MIENNWEHTVRFIKEHKTGVFVSVLVAVLIIGTMLTN